MDDVQLHSSGPLHSPVVLTAEEIFLYVHGGSVANDLGPSALVAMTPEEAVGHFCNNHERAKSNHLTADKMSVLHAQIADPDSWVNRSLRMIEERNRCAVKVDWWKALANPRRARRGEPLYLPDDIPRRGDTQVAVDRDVTVRFIRNVARGGRLTDGSATRVLAEAGESLSWVDSVPDRLIMTEPIAPVRGSAVERRKYLAAHYSVLSDLMAEQNSAMLSQLARVEPALEDELRGQLAECRKRDGGRGM